MKTIPKIIHQIWIGDKSKAPVRLMDTWKNLGEEWRYILWDEEAIRKTFGLQNQSLYNYFYKKKCYYGASDVLRLEILERYGDIYIDADTERLDDITELLDCDFFAVEANSKGRVANGIIGSTPDHPIITRYIFEMGQAEEVEPVWNTIGGTLFTKVINENKTDRSIILPPHTFYPFDSKGVKSRTEGKTYAQHFWGSTHKTYGKI